jgi:hypothetical protein
MKKRNLIPAIALLSFVSAFISPCKNENAAIQLGFDIDGKSLFTFHNDTEDSVHVNLIHWYTIPHRSQEFDSIIAPGNAIDFELITQNPTYVSLAVVAKSIKCSLFQMKEMP